MAEILKVSISEEGDVSVISFSGRMDANSSKDGDKALQEMIDNGKTKIVVCCEELSYISSSGLRILLSAVKRLRATGGDLKLSNLTTSIKDIITMTGFNRIFTIFETVEEAIESFKK